GLSATQSWAMPSPQRSGAPGNTSALLSSQSCGGENPSPSLSIAGGGQPSRALPSQSASCADWPGLLLRQAPRSAHATDPASTASGLMLGLQSSQSTPGGELAGASHVFGCLSEAANVSQSWSREHFRSRPSQS